MLLFRAKCRAPAKYDAFISAIFVAAFQDIASAGRARHLHFLLLPLDIYDDGFDLRPCLPRYYRRSIYTRRWLADFSSKILAAMMMLLLR